MYFEDHEFDIEDQYPPYVCPEYGECCETLENGLCGECDYDERHSSDTCSHCGGEGQIIVGQWFDGEYRYAPCDHCSDDDSAYDAWKDARLHTVAKF